MVYNSVIILHILQITIFLLFSLSIFIFKFKQSSYLFSLKNSHPYQDLNQGPPRYQADMLSIELSWLGYTIEGCQKDVPLRGPTKTRGSNQVSLVIRSGPQGRQDLNVWY